MTKKEQAQECVEETLEDLESTESEETAQEETDEIQEEVQVETSDEDEELKSQLIRLQADFANFKKRSEKEKQDIYKYAAEGVIGDLLNTLDNFDRAFTAIEPEIETHGFCEGMKMIHGQLIEVLEKHGLAEVEALNAEFDPNLHHAVMQVEVEDTDSNQVIEVFQKGYKVKDKVIRPAMVKVSK